MGKVCGLFLLFGALTALAAAEKPDAEALAKDLKAAKAGERIAAAKALNDLSPEVAAVVPQLVEALKDEYFDVRLNSAAALAKLGAKVVPALRQALRDENHYSQSNAARILARIGPPAKEALPELGKLLAAGSQDLQLDAAEAVLAIGDSQPVARELLNALSSSSEGVRSAAARALGRTGKAVLPELIQLLAHKDPGVVSAAARALGEIGPEAASAAPLLAKALLEESRRVGEELAKVGEGGIRDSRLRHALRGSDILPVFSKLGAAAAPPLIEALKDADDNRTCWVLEALGRTGSGAAPALPTLLGIAKGGGDLGNRARALGAIGAIGPEAASAVPSLIGALECEGKEEILARYAAGALAKLGAAAVKPLAEALQSRHPHVRRQAATALGQIGPAAKEAEAALRKAAEDGEETVRKAAQEALAALKPKE